MDSNFDIAIIGAGIVGLAAAMWMASMYPHLSIVVLEKEPAIAGHQSSHNSGVIHSGIYYRPGSLKAKLCVRGAEAMLAFCRAYNLPHEICGKVIVATNKDELVSLQELHRRAIENQVPHVALIGPERLRELEPHATGIAALHVPGTGITDYASVTRQYAQIFASSGGELRTGIEVNRIFTFNDEFTLESNSGSLRSKFLINCAGLHSDRICRLSATHLDVRIIPFRGDYYELASYRRSLIRGLIYPVVDPKFPFLGVHFTRRVDGGVEAGPNAVLALKREGYRKTDVNLRDAIETVMFPGFWRMARKHWRTGFNEFYRSLSKPSFARALQKLVPEIAETDLVDAPSGVRAQALDRNGTLLDDFYFVPQRRALHVCNVPSPAATASLMIGRAVMQMAAKEFDLKESRTSVPSTLKMVAEN